MEEENQPPPEHRDVLKLHFGHSNFRPKQWDIIRSIIEDRQDNCVVMATGYGKSLIYQYPSVYLKGLTIVISPLISLMQDQVRSLKSKNIPSCLLGSAQPWDLTENIEAGEYRIVYLTPEYAMGEKGTSLLNDVAGQLNLIAIDEAHCVSKWGHHFRQNYHELSVIRENPIFDNIPILAVTAVATPRVREDIVTILGLRNAQICCTGFDRPNLNFRVKMKGLDIWDDVRELLIENGKSSAIIYCLTQKQTADMAELINNRMNGVVCKAYHSGLPLSNRTHVQKNFMDNHVKIIVATVAFGMGIDKPDVRLVIHYGAPMELETYYLGVGQAGRDGEHSNCVMFWDKEDFEMHKTIRFKGVQDYYEQEQKLETHETQSNNMLKYLNTKDCRRKFILQYFEGINPHCCDNCESMLEASSCQTTPKGKRHPTNEEDVQPEEPSSAKQPKMEPI